MRFIAAVVTLVAVGSTGAFAAPVIVTDPSVHVRGDPSSLSVRSVLHTHALNARTNEQPGATGGPAAQGQPESEMRYHARPAGQGILAPPHARVDSPPPPSAPRPPPSLLSAPVRPNQIKGLTRGAFVRPRPQAQPVPVSDPASAPPPHAGAGAPVDAPPRTSRPNILDGGKFA
ncbi:hypothetical protein EIP91_004063 [Steccherinum ochraceum]|uniref:Uncharacterized protein n=1 Tax=Steccherinum ochraceum TaxID=92696 RepID=A0A4R0RHY6_9APHY|nr:hypothetical protein EIP91_004063 [Steccherinum ochraceum]